MPASCPYFIAITFAHVAAGLASTAAGATLGPVLPATLGATVLLTIALAAVLIGMQKIPPGLLKYAVALAWTFAFGLLLRRGTESAQAHGTLQLLLASVVGVTLAMTALGLYDRGGLLGFGPYLFAGLVGLFVARVGLLAATFVLPATAENVQSMTTTDMVLSGFGSALFAVFLAYDTSVLKHSAPRCGDRSWGGAPDYVSESTNIFLNVVNLFSNMESVLDG